MAAKWQKKSKEVVGGVTPADKPARISNKLEHVLVAESKRQPKDYLGYLKKLTRDKRRIKVAGATLLGLVILTAAAMYFGRKEPMPVVISDGPKCSYAVLEKSRPLLDPRKLAELQPVVVQIEQIPGYGQDANCLFVVATYYINAGDGTKAQDALTKLEKAYNPTEGYETVIVEFAKTPKELRPTVDFLVKQAARYQKLGPDGAPQ